MDHLGALGIADAPGIHPMGIGLAGDILDLHDLHRSLYSPIRHKPSPGSMESPCDHCQ